MSNTLQARIHIASRTRFTEKNLDGDERSIGPLDDVVFFWRPGHKPPSLKVIGTPEDLRLGVVSYDNYKDAINSIIQDGLFPIQRVQGALSYLQSQKAKKLDETQGIVFDSLYAVFTIKALDALGLNLNNMVFSTSAVFHPNNDLFILNDGKFSLQANPLNSGIEKAPDAALSGTFLERAAEQTGRDGKLRAIKAEGDVICLIANPDDAQAVQDLEMIASRSGQSLPELRNHLKALLNLKL